MRVFTWIVRSMTVGAVLICIVMIGLAPQTVVTHFNTAGISDMLGSRGWLVLLPAFLIVLAEIILRVARQKRRRLGLLHST